MWQAAVPEFGFSVVIIEIGTGSEQWEQKYRPEMSHEFHEVTQDSKKKFS